MRISEELSKGFYVANLLATMLVIAIHYNSKMHINDITSVNYWIQDFITNGIARIAVPFFALSSGIFFFLNYENLSSYRTRLIKRVSSLLVPYLIATLLILIAHYLYVVVLKGGQYEFTVSNLMSDLLLNPVSVQFWFLRDLMVLVITAPLLYFLVARTHSVFIILLSICWFVDLQPLPFVDGRPLIASETLFFFCLGCYFVKCVNNWESLFQPLGRYAKNFLVTLFLAALALRVEIDPGISLGFGETYYTTVWGLIIQKLAIILGVYLLILKSVRWQHDLLVFWASFTFFVYLYHVLPLSRFVTVAGHSLVSDPYIFYINFPVATVASFSFAYLAYRYFPRLYSLLVGARDPSK